MALVVDYEKSRKVFAAFSPFVAAAAVLPFFYVKNPTPKELAIYAGLVLLYLFPLFVAKKRHFVVGARPERLIGSMIGLVIYGLFVIYHDLLYLLGYTEMVPGPYMPFIGVVFWVIIYWLVVFIFNHLRFTKD